MPSPGFLTKAFIAGFFFGHLFVPAEKSWLFRLARSPAFDVLLSDSDGASARNGYHQILGADSLQHQEDDNMLPFSSHPLLYNLSSPNLTIGFDSTPIRPPVDQPTLHREMILPNNSSPATYRPSATQVTVSTTLYYVPSASARPQIHTVTPRSRQIGSGSVQFGLTFRSLLCVSALLYRVISLLFRKFWPKRKARRLPESVVSMIVANLQADPQSLKACSLVSRTWTKESQRHLFHTISIDSRQSADLWFSPDTHHLVTHVRSVHLSMEAIAGTEAGLSRFPSVKTLRISGWCGPQHLLPKGWFPLDRTVENLELIQPEGTSHEILTFLSHFTSLESLYITRGHQRPGCEVRAARTGEPAIPPIRFQISRRPPADDENLTRPCSDNGTSAWLHFDSQNIEEPLIVFFGCSNPQATRACGRCFTGRSLSHRLSRLILPRPGRTLSTIRIGTLPGEMVGMTDSLLVSLPCISPRSTKVTIEQFHDTDTMAVDEILPRFRSLGGVVEIGEQRVCI